MVLYCVWYRWQAILHKCLASIHRLLTQVVPLSHGSNKEWAATLLSFAVFTQSRVLLMSDDCVVRFRLLLGIVYNTFSCSSCVRMFSGGIAGIRPITILGSMVRHSYLWQSSKLGTFQTLQHLSYAASISQFVVLYGVMGSLQFFCVFQVGLPCCCSWLNLTTAVYARHLNSPRQFWRFQCKKPGSALFFFFFFVAT